MINQYVGHLHLSSGLSKTDYTSNSANINGDFERFVSALASIMRILFDFYWYNRR